MLGNDGHSFGDIAVDDMKPSLINEYFVSRKDAKPATINRYRSFLSMCFQEAIRNGKAEKIPRVSCAYVAKTMPGFVF
ncbi:hypothetical protein [Edaphobacter aggregans]|uniref:hypothetical protein n=1 Tax=Edaphobacter aggregans TaxID=570835 RepID=UPI0005574880|nr:hypothetical protein [Edaphobacter aggregans]